MKKLLTIIQSLVIGVLIIASLLLIFTHINFLGFQMFSVQSGSMEPEIKTGGIVFSLKRSGYRVGEIITFKKEETNVTHRIVDLENKDGNTNYIVKGDANDSADIDAVNSNQVVGRTILSLPYLGYFAGFLKTFPGLIIFIIIPATIIVYEEINTIKKELNIMVKKRKGSKANSNAS